MGTRNGEQYERAVDAKESSRALQVLEGGRTRYFDLYNDAPVGYCSVSRNDRILEANLRAGGLLGATPRDLVQLPLTRFILPEDQVIHYCACKLLFETYQSQTYELRMVRHGEAFWAEVSATLGEDEVGNEVCLLVFQDVSERRASGEALLLVQQAQKFESLGLMAGDIAHDFNNLLGGLFGYISLAEDCLPDQESTRKYLGKATGIMDRARAMTQQLLNLAGRGRPARLVGSLVPILWGAGAFILQGANLGISFELDEDLKLCDFNKAQMVQVFSNLLINCQQASPQGGTIRISARNIDLLKGERAQLVPGSYVEITVVDQGEGIPGPLLRTVFDPFFSTRVAGRGLGLSTCRSIIQKHGGTIDVRSALGHGTTVTVRLPAVTAVTVTPVTVAPS